MHADQLTVSVETVRLLVADQFPEWRHLPVRSVAGHGTVNALFRVGEGLTARFPLRAARAEATLRALEAEADAARELLGRTPFPTPAPVALGRPGRGYPLPWAVQTWLPGVTAEASDASVSRALAHDLAVFVRAVRSIPTAGRTFTGGGRGRDLRAHDDWVETCLRRSEGLLDVPTLRRLWASLRALPRADRDVMTHGDLTPGNVLVSSGRLAGVLDVGGLGPADPALDLVGAWHLLDTAPRAVFREDLACSDLEWARGRAWAFEQALGAVWYYADTNPAMHRMGRTTLDRLLRTSHEAAPEARSGASQAR